MSRRIGLVFLSLAALTGVLVPGCKRSGGSEGSNVGGPGPQGCPPGQVWNGQACVANTAPPPTACPAGQSWNGQACVASTNPPPPPLPTGTSGPQATPLDASAAAVAGQGLDALAKQSAPGAKPVGGTLMAGQFQQGQILETTFNAQPGKCYTVVGSGLPNVQNLDLQIVASTPLPGFSSPILSVDQTNGPNAVAAPHPNCFKWAAPVAVPLKIVMTVSAGAGVAAAQLYEK